MPRNKLAVTLCGTGLLLSAAAWLATFSIASGHEMTLLFVALFAGVLLNATVIWHIELPASQRGRVTHDQLMRDMPDWMDYAEIAAFVFVAAHFLWYTYQSRAGVPGIIDGQYVSESHGRVMRYLTALEYRSLNELFLRCGAAIAVNLYFMATMYWWFHRSRPRQDPRTDRPSLPDH